MKHRMIAIDLDGTLLCPRGTVTPRIKAAVHRAIDAGYLVCFATGRNYTECKAILNSVEHRPPCVFVGGAIVMDTKTETLLNRTLMEPELAREMCSLFESMGHAALALQDGVEVDYLITPEIAVNEATSVWMKLTEAKYHRDGNVSLGEHDHRHTLRVGIVAPPEQITKVNDLLASRYSNRLTFHRLFVPSYGVEVFEAFGPSVSKWNALQKIAQMHDVRPEQIIAVGDDLNDLSMIRNAGLGLAMGNAHPECLSAARRVLKCNHEEGLSEFLEELIASTQEAAA